MYVSIFEGVLLICLQIEEGGTTMKVTVKGRVLEIARKEEKNANDVYLFQAGESINARVRIADGKPLPKIGEEFTIEGSLLTWKTRDGVGTMVSVR